MNLDKGDGHAQQGIAQGDTGVGEGGRVDDDKIHLAHGLMDAADQLMFGIGLQVFQGDTEFVGVLAQIGDDLIERLAAVDSRLPLAQQIQVGTVEQEDSVMLRHIEYILDDYAAIYQLSVDHQKSSHFLHNSVCPGTQISQLY
ncbi:hypothetical protein D3C84_529680 [compost metagenome]